MSNNILLYILRYGAGHCFSDRKSTRLNSSHLVISYAVFCLKKKTQNDDKRSSYAPPKTSCLDRAQISQELTLLWQALCVAYSRACQTCECALSFMLSRA